MRASRLRKKSKIRFVASPICLCDRRPQLPLLDLALAPTREPCLPKSYSPERVGGYKLPAGILDAMPVGAR
jgi:hypothetical protein